MKLIVDTNVLITYFWNRSVFSQIASEKKIALIAPEYALEEINKHSKEIMQKSKTNSKEFKNKKIRLAELVEFKPIEDYLQSLKEVKKLISQHKTKDKEELLKDLDFLSLAQKEKCALWSNDKLLKEQNEIIVLNTKELINLIT